MKETFQIWTGTSGFQYPEWKGAFYPDDLPARRMLPFYAQRFSSTEINYSFRRIPSEKALLNWSALTPSEFRFSLKAPQKITHAARLRDCAEAVSFFARSVSNLSDKLGAILFQLPPDFTKDAARLSGFLKVVPSRIRPAFEFRHESWFNEEIFSILRDHNAALCLAENEELATPRVATANFGYLRQRREDYNAAALKSWTAFVLQQKKTWGDTNIYFKHEERGVGPKFASKMIAMLGTPPYAAERRPRVRQSRTR
jgi:uncharacterized protein YecE (DUF72 family)